MRDISRARSLRLQVLAWLGLAWFHSGCAMTALPPAYVANPQTLQLAPVVLFQEGTGPLSYHAATVRDAAAQSSPQTVTGETCQSGFQLPWAYSHQTFGSLSAGWGDGGYSEALTRAQAKAPAHGLLYDVRVDLRQTSILSIWRQLCVVVTASVAPNPGAPPARTPIASETEKEDLSHG